jgi:hypothetical protein
MKKIIGVLFSVFLIFGCAHYSYNTPFEYLNAEDMVLKSECILIASVNSSLKKRGSLGYVFSITNINSLKASNDTDIKLASFSYDTNGDEYKNAKNEFVSNKFYLMFGTQNKDELNLYYGGYFILENYDLSLSLKEQNIPEDNFYWEVIAQLDNV